MKPSDPEAHLWYSFHLSGLGRFDEALTEVEKARKLDPNSPAINAYIVNPLLWARRFDEIIQKMGPLAEMYPNYSPPHFGLAMAYEQKREWEKAIPEMEKANALEMTQDGLSQLGHMYAVSGRTQDARRVLRQLIEMSHHRYVSAYNFGVLYAGLGEREQAFRWFQKVEEDRSEAFAAINVDPRLDALHSDPRWAGILRSVGLSR